MQNRYSLVESIRRIVQQEMQSAGGATGNGFGQSGGSGNAAPQGGARRGLLKQTAGSSGRKGLQGGGVAQAQAQAQAELSEELAQNLQKLKQVIGESQKIAQKIETVLGKGGQNE